MVVPIPAYSSSAGPQDGPVGIGGWLVLPILGVALTLLRAPFHLAELANLGPALTAGSAAQSAFVLLEIVGNFVLLIVLPAYLLYLVYRKSYRFPAMYVVFAIAAAVFMIADLIVGYILVGHIYEATGTAFMDQDTWIEVLRTAILVFVWVPYMKTSRRVANTFVE